MTKTSKQEFMNRPKIRVLSKKEREKRYSQHLASSRANASLPGYTRNTTMVPRTRARGTVAEMHLSPCAKEYFLAQQAPFSLKSTACVPDLHAVPSKKVRLKTRFNFSTGTDGNGSVSACCWCNASTGSAIVYTTALSGPSTGVVTGSTPNVGLTGQSKLPYTFDQFRKTAGVGGVKARTVATAMRIRYTGPDFTKSGQITAVRQPTNQNLQGLTFDQVKGYQTAKTFSNQRQWVYVFYRPVAPADYEFSPDPNANAEDADGSGSNAKYEIGFTVQGTTSNATAALGPASFEGELIRFVEYTGEIDNITRSHVDIVGMSHVRNSLGTKSVTDKPHTHLTKAIKRIEDDIGESLPAAGLGAMAYSKYIAPAAESESASIMGTISEMAGTAMGSLGEFAAGALGIAEEAAPILLL